MKITGYFVLLYGLLVLLGGAIGYVKANSVPSLVMGSSFGIVLMICGGAMLKGSSISLYVATLFALLLTCFFGYRFLNTYSFMPAGLMALFSLIALVVLFFEGYRQR